MTLGMIRRVAGFITQTGGVNDISVEVIGTAQVDGVNRIVYTFSGFGIDSGDAGKVAVVDVSATVLTAGWVPSSLTIGGATATKLCGTNTDTNIDGSSSLWAAVIGGSPTDEVVITFQGTIQACAVSPVILLTGASGITPHDTFETKSGSAGTSITGSIDTPTGGVLILGSYTQVGTSGAAFTGDAVITEDTDTGSIEGTTGRIVLAHRADGIERTGETITYTGTSSWHHITGASFSP